MIREYEEEYPDDDKEKLFRAIFGNNINLFSLKNSIDLIKTKYNFLKAQINNIIYNNFIVTIFNPSLNQVFNINKKITLTLNDKYTITYIEPRHRFITKKDGKIVISLMSDFIFSNGNICQNISGTLYVTYFDAENFFTDNKVNNYKIKIDFLDSMGSKYLRTNIDKYFDKLLEEVMANYDTMIFEDVWDEIIRPKLNYIIKCIELLEDRLELLNEVITPEVNQSIINRFMMIITPDGYNNGEENEE